MKLELPIAFSAPRLPSFKLPTLKAPKWTRNIGWRTLLGGLLLGGIVHICYTFSAPLGSGLAFRQLRANLPLNKMTILPPSSPGRQALPFLSPDMLYAICRYDLSKGPVAVTAAVAGLGWLLSLHTPQGDNFYVLPGQQLQRSEVSLVVVPGSAADAAHSQRFAGGSDNQVASPTAEGLIIIRAPILGLAWLPQTDALLRRSSCTPVQR